MRRGWTKSWRKKLDHPLYRCPLVWHYFDFCVSKANIKDKEWMVGDSLIVIKRGSFVTSLEKTSSATGLSFQNIRTAQKKLQKLGMISQKATNKFTVITVCNYELYQCAENDAQQTTNKQTTNKQQTNNKQLTTTKEGKERKEGERNISKDCSEFKNLNSKPTGSGAEDKNKNSDNRKNSPPKELEGLELYESDKRLCDRWPDLIKNWQKAYPHMDVVAEIIKAHAWEIANPAKRKKNRPSFLGRWLSRAQDGYKKQEGNDNAGSSKYAGKSKGNGKGRWGQPQAEIDLPPDM